VPALAEQSAAWRPRTEIALDALESPITRRSLQIWQAVRAKRAYPSRAEMLPRALAPVLRNVALITVCDDGEFAFRVMGDAILQQQGAALHNKTMAEIDAMLPNYGTLLRRLYRNVLDERVPRAFRGWYERPVDRHPFHHEAVILPLSSDGSTIDHLVVIAADV